MKKLGFDLILLGDSTSGKDTQALLLAKKYDVILARSGDYLRKLKTYNYRQGVPAPSNLIINFLDYFLKKGKNKNIVFVGAARLKNEAQYLVKELKKKNRNFFVIYIKIPKTEVIKRSRLRAARLEDTDLKLINSRINYYKTKVSKTIAFYQDLRKIKLINGKQSIKNVSQDIEKAIHDYQRSQGN